MTERERNTGDYRGRETDRQEDSEQREREARGQRLRDPRKESPGR
jgi:hypothetical protein